MTPLLHRLMGLVLVVLALAGGLGAGGGVGVFWDLPSLMLVGLLTLGTSWFALGPGALPDAVWAVFAGPGGAGVDRRRRRVAVMGLAYQCAWGAGLMGTLLALVAMLADLSSPSAIGAGMAVALLATLYGAALAEFGAAPCRQVLVQQMEAHDQRSDQDKGPRGRAEPDHSTTSAPWRGACVVLLMLSVFSALIVSFAKV